MKIFFHILFWICMKISLRSWTAWSWVCAYLRTHQHHIAVQLYILINSARGLLNPSIPVNVVFICISLIINDLHFTLSVSFEGYIYLGFCSCLYTGVCRGGGSNHHQLSQRLLPKPPNWPCFHTCTPEFQSQYSRVFLVKHQFKSCCPLCSKPSNALPFY